MLLGFTSVGTHLFAVVEQRYVQGEQADLADIRELLRFNGFENIKRQDYYNSELGLLLEDMHDENVIAKDGLLFFIDTVYHEKIGHAAATSFTFPVRFSTPQFCNSPLMALRKVLNNTKYISHR